MKKKWLFLIIIAAIAVVIVTAMNMKKQQSYTFYSGFDTITTIQFTATDRKAKEIAAGFEKELIRYHELFDIYYRYQDVNNIKMINDLAGVEPVLVDRDIIDMLKLAQQIYEASKGKVNVAMGSVLSIWHDYRTEGMEDTDSARLPDMAELEAANQHTDINDLVIDDAAMTVYLKDADMRLDVGAIAKGYAAQKLAGYLKDQGIESGLLDVGGNVIAIGEKTDGSAWRLAIQNPDLNSDCFYVHVIGLKDMVIVTSGDYQRYYTVNGQKYHHIIDSETLMPTTYFSSVSVVAKDSGLADGLSTALFSMSLEDGMQLLNNYPEVEVLWITPEGEEYMTEHFSDYLIE